MRTLITLIVFLAVIAGAVGWYQGWFQVSKDTHEIKVTLDKDKLKEETEKAKAKARDFVGDKTDSQSAPASTEKKEKK